jgi:hypothetical protein
LWRRVDPVPRVSPLNSQVAFRSQASGAVFSIAAVPEGFHGPCLGRVSLPEADALFPGPTLGASWAAGFPTLFSTASGVVGLVAGPSGASRLPDCRVRLFSPLQRTLATPACGPRQDTPVMLISRLARLAGGRPPLLTVRWPRATGLASYLSGCVLLTVRRRRL